MRNNKPLIGVTVSDNKNAVFWWCIKLAVSMAGGKAVRISVLRPPQSLDKFNGFIISGGQDISPKLYGQPAALEAIQYDLGRDEIEQNVIKYAIENKKSILGICRGMQILNVTLGGSLYQEVSDILDDFLPSKSILSKFIGRRDVKIDKSSKLFKILGDYQHYRVNSIHHQAVNELGEGLKIVAKEENGLTQAIESKSSENSPFMIGVQWHPELMLHAKSARNIFKEFVKSAKGDL